MKTFRNTAAMIVLAAVVIVPNTPAEAGNRFPPIQWRFGINVSLTNTFRGAGLVVKHVDPHGPSYRVLHRGDVVLNANGQGFHHARNDYHAVSLLQEAVTQPGGGVGGVPTATNVHFGPIVQMQVLRHGELIWVTVSPEPAGNHGGVPTRVR